MKFHPLSEILPLMEGGEFDGLVADIEANGLREPITIYEGLIIDGRNRFLACKKLGIIPHTKKLNGEDPLAFVMSENLHRRHLTKRQRAWAAQQVANMREGRPSKNDTAQNCAVSQLAAAEQFKVSRRSVQAAAYVAKHGNDKDKEDAASGRIPAGRISERIKNRNDPETKAKKAEESRRRREPAKRARQEKSVIKTILVGAQQLEAAARNLEAIEKIPDMGERIKDVIHDLRMAHKATGRFVRRLESTNGGQHGTA